jgi:opacity protein-like surface antigen
MASIRSLMLGAVLAVAASSSVLAADLGDYGSMKDDMNVSDVSMSRFYIRGDLSYSWMREGGMVERLYGQDWEMSDTDIENTWAFGGGLGWYLSPNFRTDLTLDYHRNAEAHGIATVPLSAIADPDQADYAGDWNSKFNVQSTVLLANFYYDFGSRQDFNPYIGVGLGWAFNKTNGGTVLNPTGSTYDIDGANQTNFAWALMAGVTKDLGHGFNMDMGYRYLNMGDAHTGNIIDNNGLEIVDTDPIVNDITAHQVRLGLRYDIY